jgi:energy-converting hydrogenase Eha subunit C
MNEGTKGTNNEHFFMACLPVACCLLLVAVSLMACLPVACCMLLVAYSLHLNYKLEFKFL